MIDRIDSLSPEDRLSQESSLFHSFPSLPGLDQAKTILLYLSAFREEIPTRDLWRQARDMGKRILLPRVARNPRRLRLFEVSDLETDLEARVLGIEEPRLDCIEHPPGAVDWALIPGLAFDLQGYRIGRAGGYYDRLLPTLRPDTICWAIGFDCQLVDALPREAHDAPVSGVTVPFRTVRGVRGRQEQRSS